MSDESKKKPKSPIPLSPPAPTDPALIEPTLEGEWQPDWTAEEMDRELDSDRPESLFAPEAASIEEESGEEPEDLSFDLYQPPTPPPTPMPLSSEEDALTGAEQREGLMRWDEALTLEGQVEAILFAAPKPLTVAELGEILQDEEGLPALSEIEKIVSSLSKLYRERSGGFRLEHEKGLGFQFRTVPAAAPLMERMFASRQRPLSRAALETLAIIAYRQPATRADIEYIRGVDAGSIIKNLLERELIACVGRKEDAGRPMMFGTSSEFLRVFRIQSLSDLPPLSAFQPAADVMAEAMHRLEQGDHEVDVETFIEDPEQEHPDVSEGLALVSVPDDFTASEAAFQVRDSDTQAPPGDLRSGARFDAEGIDQDDRRDKDQDPKVALPARSGLETGSRTDAGGREDLDQRPREQGDGHED